MKILCVLVLSLTTCGVTCSEFCENDKDCDWQVQSGFDVLDYTSLKQHVCPDSPACSDIGNITGNVLFLNTSNDEAGLVSHLLTSTTHEPCFVIRLYAHQTAGIVTIKSNTDGKEEIIKNITLEKDMRWKDLDLQFIKTGKDTTISIETKLKETSGLLVITQISETDQCLSSPIINTCADNGMFQCGDGTCISWDKVCNLQDDCGNGNDEGICENLPKLSTCTFENGTCGWTLGKHFNGFKWELHHGPRAPSGTGPNIDHTTGTDQGYYMYIDSDHDGGFYEPAKLQSQVMPAVGENFLKSCKLRFFYHMLGKDVNRMEIKAVDLCNKRVYDLWSKKGGLDDEWNYAEVNINISSRYFITIRGFGAAHNAYGDIALDDISFSPECFGISHDETQFISIPCHKRTMTREEFETNSTLFCKSDQDVLRETCSKTDHFSCDDSTCTPLDQVCNLKQDCQNGRDEQICDSLPEHARCTFEDGMCGWRARERVEGFSWTLQKGPTGPEYTGPTVDHTKGTVEGQYVYIDGAKGDAHEHATLHSLIMPEINDTFIDQCKFRFFYHMYGKDVTTLNVWVTEVCTDNKVLLWSQHNGKDDVWVYDEISLPIVSSRYVIELQAYGALIEHGDIAIDDISFSPECFGISYTTTGCMSTSTYNAPVTIYEFRNNTEIYCHTPQSITISSPIYTSEQAEKMNIAYIVVITVGCIAVAIIMGSALLCFAIRRRKSTPGQGARLEMATQESDDNSPPVQSSSIDMQLRCAVTELNPNYDFIIARYPEQQLREIPRNKLTLTKLLGQGAFGEVYEGTLKNLCANVSELLVAVKTLPALSTEQAETDFLMEAVIISKFMHKNVVKCLGVCFEEHPRYIILELLDGGDLRTFLRDSRTKGDQKCSLTMEDLLKLSLDIANGCRHLEEKHFVHRDIAARNCLLTSRGPDRIAKIADFGMSRDIYSADYYRKDGKAMLPVKWMPPEAFLDGVFTSKTDTWAYGVLLWEIFTLGYMPYPGQTNSDVMHFVASGGRLDPPEKSPARLSKIMIMCWNSVADIRPSFSEIIDLLDMCLQDEEVLNTDVSLFQYPINECFKDASTLAKSSNTADDSADKSSDSQCEGASGTAAEFKGHFESQSREPLLLSSPDC
ncbi:MAM and LDL-receptor class A domain-containing protein 1-like isoform X2 [Ruditapes philippinarum]|uniref:MAM and LDL-receptor class A domain-containing protein 1-like isoform X2 n=1 Tax=Ruditapes philippinarum TaxID=129788 RepID=UPI00295B1C56|nr:MAM and LDL-receptor class A domain-containing protein 1-like isoform X2 [Ruditapes philippinarum]